jgi:hypothetical protein
LYLSGENRDVGAIQALFDGTLGVARDAGTSLGAASGLKMAFSSFQKAARPLAAVAHALARHHGVDQFLADEAATMPSDILPDTAYLPSVAARAWRWAPEMHEISDALDQAGLPAEQAHAAAAVLAHWNEQKDDWHLTVDETLDLLGATREPD